MGADVRRKQLAAHQKSEGFFKRQQTPRPSGGGSGNELKLVPMAERQGLLLADHLDGWQVRDLWLFALLSRGCRFAL